MLQRITKSAVVGMTMLALAVPATAADLDLNIYGASAQFLYWEAAAPVFLNGKGCTDIAQDRYDSRNGITRGTCGSDTVYLRYSSKASFDGILAVKGDSSMAGSAEKCSEGDPGVPTGQAGFYRKMIDPASCPWDGTGNTNCSALKCYRVTLGASDVAGETFTQASSGNLKGPAGGGTVTRSFNGIDTSGLDHYNPLIVPFAFFAHDSVTRDSSPIENLPRMMPVQIFAGQAWYWSDFGGDFNTDPIVACMRHAGSGTQATLDYAVMRGNGWGANYYTAQNSSEPTVWFNDGSSDMMSCLNRTGGIGFADADQSPPSGTHRLKYQGEEASRVNIRNGRYDFWSTQWLYENPSAPNYSTTHPWISGLMAFAENPDNIPTAKANWWAAKSEMVYMKTTDKTYPQYVGCTDCQTP